MKIIDKGIILSSKPFQENKFVIKILSEENGICSGIAKIGSAKNMSSYSTGMLVKFQHFFRLQGQLGKITCEPIKSYQGTIVLDKNNLMSFKNITNSIINSFAESISYKSLFDKLLNYMESLKIGKFSWLDYFNMEIEILRISGYGIELRNCAVCENNCDLAYISPKSGKAVGESCAGEYKNLLLKLPKFLLTASEPSKKEEIENAVNLIEYFQNRYIFNHLKTKPTYFRRNLEYIVK